MIELLQKTFYPFSIRGLRNPVPGDQERWLGTVCVNGCSVGKVEMIPQGCDATGQAEVAIDLFLDDDTHVQHLRRHVVSMMDAKVLVEKPLEQAMVDLVTLMFDAYLGDKNITRWAKDGVLIYRLASDPVNGYRRASVPYSADIAQQIRQRHGQDLEWIANEAPKADVRPSATVVRLPVGRRLH